ncbi:hypothetical protein AB0B63_20745 [Micromonospora sp. NPDC049081]|uniref:hypothetical protein n=1 Tax=Micromonospora sp. NPDC049081 TaxID=3155150 RepID=UPI00340CAECD
MEFEPDVVARVDLHTGDPHRIVAGPGERPGAPVVVAGEAGQARGQVSFEVAEFVGETGEVT